MAIETAIANDNEAASEENSVKNRLFFLQYRGKCSEDYARALHRIQAIAMTLRKLRTVLLSLKPPIPKELRSGVFYQIQCPRCDACYDGQTDRHLQTRFKQHVQKKQQPVDIYLRQCGTSITYEDTEILASTTRGEA